MKIDTEEIKKDFCQSFCVMYSGEDYECGKGGLCPFKGKITHQKEIEEERNKKIFHLVTKDLKFIDPEEEEFRANNILGIVVRYSHSAKAWMCMSLNQLNSDCQWSIDLEVDVQTTLDNSIENIKILKSISPDLSKFPAAKAVEEYAVATGKNFYLGSSDDMFTVQMKANIIKDMIERYRLKSNINFGNAFWTSSTGYDKYICGLSLGSYDVHCFYGRDSSCSVLPCLAILDA